ncbi:MAG: AAA family ATPase [Calditrichia bacterium]
MKIKEFLIQRYGPVSTPEPLRLSNFNLFYGDNEDGKTLTLESLVRLLFGKSRKAIGDMIRLDESPEGYVVLERQDGDELKLPEAGQLSNFYPLSAEESRNLFIICNSDLTIARETEFYGSVTERLTGLRTNHIKQLKQRLRSDGFFTEKMDMVNTKDSQHVKRRYEQARELLEHCRQITEDAKFKGYDTLEEDLVDLQQHARELERKTDGMERARLQAKYTTGKTHLQSVRSTLLKLDALQGITEDDLLTWKQAETLITEKEQEKEKASRQLKEHQHEMLEEEQYVREVSQSMDLNLNRKKQIDSALKPLLAKLGHSRGKSGEATSNQTFHQILIFFMFIASVVSLAGYAYRTDFFMLGLSSLVGLITCLLALLYYWQYLKPHGDKEEVEVAIKESANKLAIAGDSAKQIVEQVQRFEEMVQRQQQNLASSESRISYLQNASRGLEEERIPEIETRLQDAKKTITDFRTRHETESLQNLRDRLDERKKYEEEVNAATAVLGNLFGKTDDPLTVNVARWEEELAELEGNEPMEESVDFDEKKLEKRRTEQKNAEEEIAHLQRQLRDFREKLSDVGRRANETLAPEDSQPVCRTLADLKQLRRHLRNFIEQVEYKQRIAKLALDVVEEIGATEEQKVSSLFGEESSISDYYDTITEGLYTGVFYESVDNTGIQVRRRDGKMLSPNVLSGGAFDQLYLTIRISLAEKLLDEEKGFFIFDDPFLKSDTERLRRQMELLLDLSQQGWQVLYFTAKDEVKNTLQKYIDVGQVTLQPVPGLAFKEELGNRFNGQR